MQQRGNALYAVTVSVLPIRPGASSRATVQRFLTYEERQGNAVFAHVRWSSTSLGGKAALSGVMSANTEGGVALSIGVYVAGWRSHVYEVTMNDSHRPAPRDLRHFPTVYREITGSWRFL